MEKEPTINLYAIVDIETTGGKFDEEGITEIAIYKFDGFSIVDQFISLVNPEREIQPFVVNLTGINNGMLKNAPKFYEIAKRIVEITTDCVLVAHNASFDYRILATEFRRLGFQFERKTLCTVDLSQKLIPHLPSYKLGKLCRTLGIPVSSRHRAEGDALATVQLFKLLLDKDSSKEIIKQSVKTANSRKIAPKLLAFLDELPAKPGIFYIHNNERTILYIGRGKNIKKEANNLFLKTSKNAVAIQNNVVSVSHQLSGTELLAELQFTEVVKLNKPPFTYISTKKARITTFNNENFLLIDKGREVGEKSVLLFENNQLKGYCYTSLHTHLTNIEQLKTLLTPLEDSVLNRHIIKKYLNGNAIEKLVRF